MVVIRRLIGYKGYSTNSCQFHQKNCNISNLMYTSQIFTAATKYKKKSKNSRVTGSFQMA